MRAAIYARYSSELQRDASIEDQVRVCKERIEREGWSLNATYTDHAMSGASRLRPGYQKLLEDARNGAFDIVVAEALDRLSRDQEDVAALYKQLRFADIKLITLAEGEVTELHIGLMGTMNALYLKDLAAKTHRGLEGRVRKGRSAGGKAYGYDVVRETGADGEPVRGKRRINAAEAATVRLIFRDYGAGKSPRAIARDLNAEGIPGPGGRPWGDTTIRGHATRRTGILRNDLYIGRLVWNKQRYIKDPDSGKRVARINPGNEWIVKEVSELRIVEQASWDKVQERLDEVRRSPMVEKARRGKFWEKRRPKHLLTGLVRCGVCDGTYASVGRDYLACGRARRQGNCDNRRGIPRAKLEGLILDGLKERLMAPELVKMFIAAYHAEINNQRDDQEHQVAHKRRELERLVRKHAGLVDAIADGLRTDGLLAELTALEQRKADLAATIDDAPAPLPRLHPNLAEVYRQKVADLHETLNRPDTRAEALDILRGLIDSVILRPVDKGIEIELVGNIARMLKLPEGRFTDQHQSSVKVVAGAGFEPATFRL